MDSILTIKLITFVASIFLSAFFSSAETAFTAINSLKLRSLVEQKVKGAKTLERILKKRRQLITAILIGNNIANVGASALATTVILDILTKLNIYNYATGMAIVTGIVTFILLIFGEITPKTIAIKNSEKLALLMTKPIYAVLIILTPFIYLFTFISQIISKILRISNSDVSQIINAEEIKAIVNIGLEEGILEEKEKDMIESIFQFSDTVAREIMTPRTDATCIAVSTTIQEAVEQIIEVGYSRIPIYEDKIDNIVGILYAKDLLHVRGQEDATLHKFIKPAVFTPETKPIQELLHFMKTSKQHLAIIVDEHGGFSGLATMEDIIEEILGEIQDEYDEDEIPLVQENGENRYLIDAKIDIDDLAEEINITFPEDAEYDTFGGFALDQLGKFPTKGETFTYENFTITIGDIRKRRIKNMIVVKNPEEEENSTDDES